MTTVVSTLFVSFDGVAEVDPTWHFPYFDDAMGAAVTEDYADVDVLLLGRVTYDSFAGAWPGREAAGGVDASYAKQLGDTRKVVATHEVGDLGWRNVEATPDVVARVAELRGEPGVDKVLVAGSISIVRQLLAAGQLDELRLLVHPVIAGAGRHLFDPAAAVQPLRLLSSESFPTGVLRLRYAPADLPRPASTKTSSTRCHKAPGDDRPAGPRRPGGRPFVTRRLVPRQRSSGTARKAPANPHRRPQGADAEHAARSSPAPSGGV